MDGISLAEHRQQPLPSTLPVPNHQNGNYSLTVRPSRRLSANYRPQIQSLLNRPDGLPTRQRNLESPTANNTNYANFRKGAEPDGKYVFSVTWGTILKNLRGEGLPESREARNRLDQICTTTEAYIATPDYDTNIAFIYGNATQVSHARQQLEFFEKDVRGRGVRPSAAHWVKLRAHDGRKEHRQERQTQLQQYLTQYHQLDEQMEFDFDDYLLWPGDLDLEQFIAEYDSSVLQNIRQQFLCRIEFDTTIGLIHTSTQSEKVLMVIRGRIVNLVKEMVARLNRCIRLNLFRMPSASTYRSKIGLDKDPYTGLILPTLHGEPLPETEKKEWATLRRQVDRQNRQLISLSVEKCLKSMQVAKQHVRMRLTFGELGFRRHRKPTDGSDVHSFDDFCDMVRNERTEMHAQGLRSTGGNLALLGDKLDEVQKFYDGTDVWAVHFDFHVPGQSSTLRLETEFRLNAISEIEVASSRWLEYKHGEESELLEVNMLEFEKPNWQFHLGAVSFCENPLIQSRLELFSHNLGFRAPIDGLKSDPKRRAIYPPGHQELRRLSELTMRRYRVKDTDGFLEIRRRDVYDETPGQSSAIPTSTHWTAAYYYPEWDNLLGELAYLQPGEEAEWTRALPTFFPDSADVERPDGFRKFMREVEEIQDLLGDAILQLPKVTNGSL